MPAASQTDFRSFGVSGPPRPAADRSERRWWTQEPDAAAHSVTDVLTTLKEHQRQRMTQYIVSARLYGNLALLGAFGTSLSRVSATSPGFRDRITYNAIQSAVDTVAAKIAKNKPKPLFLTSNGDYRQQRKAKRLNQFCDGIFYENDAHALGVGAFRDGCVWGDGFVHVFVRGDRVSYERVLPMELWVDEIEAQHGEPRQLHRVKHADRQVLADLFPEKRELIQRAGEATVTGDGVSRPHVSDLVTVRESWHLPSGPEAKDGRHFLTIDEGPLTEMEEWKHEFFPFARFRWCPRLFGFWSQGLAEQVQNLQLELNKLMWIVQRSFHLAGTFKILLEDGSKVVTEHLNNDVGAIVKYRGAPPQYIVPPVCPPEYFQQIATLKEAIYSQAGISQLSAASLKPAGLNSGRALREMNDIESDRFQIVGQEYERFYMDLARKSIATMKDAMGTRGGYKVRAPGRRWISTIDWKDIALDDDDYIMQCFPISSLPSDPAGRLQTIQEYVQAGWIDPDHGRRLSNFPDLDREETLLDAQENRLVEIIDLIVDEGKFTPPEPYDNLALGYKLALQMYASGRSSGLEEERLDLLRQFMDQVAGLMAESAPPAPPAPPDGGVAQAPPVPAQASELVPNAPGILPQAA